MNEQAQGRWYFEIEDFEEESESEYPDANGVNVGYGDARDTPFVGTMLEADREAQRRADLWETLYDCLASRVTYHSLGEIKHCDMGCGREAKHFFSSPSGRRQTCRECQPATEPKNFTDFIGETIWRVAVKTCVENLASHRYRSNTELELQDGIAQVLAQRIAPTESFQREYDLSPQDRIDFFHADGLGIEVKVDGSYAQVARQLHRYAQHDAIKGLILVTTRTKHKFTEDAINGKPFAVVCLALQKAF